MSFSYPIPLACLGALTFVACAPQPAPIDDDSGTAETGSDTGSTGPDQPTGSTSSTAPTGEDSGTPDDGGLRPRESEWQTAVDALPFPADVTTLTVGRLEYNGNFANRGDVEVRFDQDAAVITIETRVHDFNDAAGFADTVSRTSLWAFVTADAPQKPSAMPPADDCTTGAWKQGCKVYAYYDGQNQPVRSGMDLRVHLPRSYRGELIVETEDSTSEPSYPRPGDVVVDGLCGSGDVSLAQGEAKVKLCRELTPTPTCPADQVAECESFMQDGQDAAWSPQCPCAPELYGQLRVHTRKPWAGDITIDMPGTTWINVTAANEETNKPHACVPELANCGADTCVVTSDEMFSTSAEFNYPSPAAPMGAGYNITAVASGCAPVSFFAAVTDWIDLDSAPMIAERGHVRVCTDCL